MMNYNIGFKTDIGRKRSQNQDSGGAFPELGLFLVSDGMGGHKGGETASATAVEVISNYTRQATQRKHWDAKSVLVEAIHAANKAIFELSQKKTELRGMGTTTTALLFKNQLLTIGHVGDSRCYFCRPNAIWQTTRDHSLVQEKLKAGLITRKEIRTDRMKNVITRSVGFEKTVDVEIYQMDVQSGDCFLVCSDGLSGLIEDPKILEIVQRNFFTQGNIQKAVDELVDTANSNGGDDNITTVMVQVN